MLIDAARNVLRRAWSGDRVLVIFAAALCVLALLMALAGTVDVRVVRGMNVWIKPVKFALSIALLALTTAFFASFVEVARRGLRPMRLIRWAVLATGGFEQAYITLQAALGQASHYNVGDALHGTMYTLMGIGAVTLAGTQPALAWQIHRHAAPGLAPALKLSIVVGLVLSFVLGVASGMLLSAAPPPSPGLPLLGWSTVGGDLRVAHFIGIHASQLLPLAGWLIARRAPHAATPVWAASAALTLLFVAAFAQALAGQPLIAA